MRLMGAVPTGIPATRFGRPDGCMPSVPTRMELRLLIAFRSKGTVAERIVRVSVLGNVIFNSGILLPKLNCVDMSTGIIEVSVWDGGTTPLSRLRMVGIMDWT